MEGTLHSTIWICPACETKPGTATLTTHSKIQYVTTAYPGLSWSFKTECKSPKKAVPTALQLLSTLPPPRPPQMGLIPQPSRHVGLLTCKSKSSFRELLRCCISQYAYTSSIKPRTIDLKTLQFLNTRFALWNKAVSYYVQHTPKLFLPMYILCNSFKGCCCSPLPTRKELTRACLQAGCSENRLLSSLTLGCDSKWVRVNCGP